ncbi:MAG: polysaccharide pyruvyl transferase CsaB, partial [Candidatus Margulisiibacteriota bacterium]
MKAVISGYYGFGNTGDEAILESLISGLRKRDPEIGITVLSADPAKTSKTHDVASIKRLDLLKIIKTLKRSNAFISGGGGLLQDSTGAFSVIYYLSIFLLAKLLGCKCAFLAQGFGPVKNPLNKLFSSLVLNKADIITVRDDRSLDEMISIGIRKPPLLLAADLAFLLEEPKPLHAEELLKDEGIKLNGKRLLGVSVRKPVKDSEGFYKRLAVLLDKAAKEKDCDIIFIPFEMPRDAEDSLKVMRNMKSGAHLLSGIYPPKKILQIISKMDFFVGMRFHSLVFAAKSHVPFIGIAYDPKVSSLLNSLAAPCLGMDFDPEAAFNGLNTLIEKRDGVQKNIKEKVGMFKVRAGLNFSAFFEENYTTKIIFK